MDKARDSQNADALLLLREKDDVVLFIFGFVDFPTLVRMQRVCTYWKQMVHQQAIPARLGSKQFLTHEELVDKIRKYCGRKLKFAEELAGTYGWPIGKWNVSRITNFSRLFWNQRSFNEDICEWDVSNATTLYGMFRGAERFHQDLSKWNTSNVTNMSEMFHYAINFNGQIAAWNTSNVSHMECMFANATSFDGDISVWDTSQVICMNGMLMDATSFNQDISSWNVAKVIYREFMFQGATSFHNENAPRFKNVEINSLRFV